MSPLKIAVEKDEAEDLPAGWTLKVRKRKSGSAKKLDRFYTDPVTGYIFRSLKDVHRYLKTGEPGRLSFKPKPKNLAADALGEVAVDAEPKTHKARREAGIEINLPPLSPRDTKTSSLSTHQAGIKIDSPLPSPRGSETGPLVGTEVVSSPPEPKTRLAKCVASNRENASPASLPQPKTRRATRQSGIKIDSPPPSPPDTRTSLRAKRVRLVNSATQKENDKQTENADIDNNPNRSQEHNKEIEMAPATLPPPEHQAQPTVLPVDFEKRESPVVDTTVGNPISQNEYGYGGDMKSDSSINFSLNDLWTDPCIEFAVKTLTGAIPLGDLNKPENFSPSPSEVHLEELWTDPCIEFAVKTLTGAIPVGEDDSLQHKPASSRNPRAPHDFYGPNVGMSFYQTNLLSKQQDSTFGNGGLHKSGNG